MNDENDENDEDDSMFLLKLLLKLKLKLLLLLLTKSNTTTIKNVISNNSNTHCAMNAITVLCSNIL